MYLIYARDAESSGDFSVFRDFLLELLLICASRYCLGGFARTFFGLSRGVFFTSSDLLGPSSIEPVSASSHEYILSLL
jgi:hypothetical protein